jgi:glycosyltransferase involved in cell wall biosynthesis
MLTATAFVTMYNEADIIEWTIRHLIDQGVGVHIIDNWSTDGSSDIAMRFPLVGYEKFPSGGPSKYYSWQPMLHLVEELAARSKADFVCHHDSDEIRRSPRPGERLIDAFARVDREGYTAIDHEVFHFRPTDDLYTGDPENHFKYYILDDEPIRSMHHQVKVWKNFGQRVDLRMGGHQAWFSGVKIYPEKFITKHYPMRTAAQAERKIIHERMERYDPNERANGWHVQYNGIAETRNWIQNPRDLIEWKEPVTA